MMISDGKPDGGCLAWTIVASSFMVSFLQDGFRDSFGLLLPAIADHFKVGRAEAALTSSFMTLLTLGSGPLVAALLTSNGHRKVTLAGVALATIGLLLSALYIQVSTAPSILVLYLTIGLLTGLGFGLMYLPAMDIVEQFFSRRLGLAMGLACCGSGFGQFVLAPLLHLATEHLGLTGTLYCLSATVAAAVFFALLYRLPSNEKEIERIEGRFRGIDNLTFQYQLEQAKLGFDQRKLCACEGEREMKESTKATKADCAEETDVVKKAFSLKLYTSVLSSPPMLLLLLSHFLLHLGIFSYFSFSTDRVIQSGGLSKGESSLLLSIIGVSNCLGRIIFGQLLDRFRPWTLQLTSIVVLTNALAVLSGDLIASMVGHGVHSAVFGFTFGAYVCSIVPVIKVISKEVTVSLGLCLFTFSIASLVGPLAVGGVYDAYGSYSPGFLGVGTLGVLGALILPAIAIALPNNKSQKQIDGS